MTKHTYHIWMEDVNGIIYSKPYYARFSAAMTWIRDHWCVGSFRYDAYGNLKYKAWAIVRQTTNGNALVAAVYIAQSREWTGKRLFTDLVPRKAA
jgi:hypothetical protein